MEKQPEKQTSGAWVAAGMIALIVLIVVVEMLR
jgi:hypothetical protein